VRIGAAFLAVWCAQLDVPAPDLSANLSAPDRAPAIVLRMARIQVLLRNGNVYDVTIQDGRGTSHHLVTVWPSDVERYAPGAAPEALVEASFRFLLEREPKEAILARFDLPVIERYFPEYPSLIAGMIGAA